MILKEIELENFKSFEKIALKFEKGFNLLVGNNGAGKSSVLEGISLGMASFFEKTNDLKCKGIVTSDVRSKIFFSGDVTATTEYYTPTCISSSFSLKGKDFCVTRVKKDESSSSKTTNQPKKLANEAQSLLKIVDSSLPLLSFQSSSRVWQQKRSDFASELKALSNGVERKCGYVGCLDSAIDTKGIVNWVLSMDYAEYQKKSEIKEYKTFRELVAKFMQEMDELPDSPKLHYSTTLSDLVYETKTGIYKISQLSAGYQSVLWMVMDLAYRSVTLNPSINMAETPITGIVLIDEIDMHLHPKWQWKIIDALTRTFPSVQFIAATHSPIVISSCKNANIILIDENHKIDYLPSGYGVSVNDVLDLRLGSIDKPEVVSKLVADFDEAMETFDKDTVQKKIIKLEKELGNDHPQVVAARNEFTLGLLIEEI